MRNLRLLSGASLAAALGLFLTNACSSSSSNGTSTTTDGGGDRETAAPEASTEADATLPPEDAGVDAPADAPRDANVRDANGPGAVDALCSFNYDCQAALRCECSEDTGCACKTGARGTGRNGITSCTSGNDCASAVCVEGPPGTGSFCSDECGSSADCVGPLPVCQSVTFVGTICIRTPPK
jgi:hypothetical protein